MKKRNLIAVLMSVVLAATSTVDMPTFAAADQPQEITEQEAVAYLCAELGIDDWDAYIADLAARYHADENNGGTRDTCPFDPDYFIDIYTGGSSNGQVDSLDAMYLLNFLNGKVNYPYVYTDLDPTQDCIVDRADVQALMDCFTMVILLEEYSDFVPGTHGASRTPDTTSEIRHYLKHTYGNDWSATNDKEYYLSVGNLPLTLPIPNYNAQSEDVDSLSTSNNRLLAPDADLRIVRNAGTGFIIGDHLIATAAHCVYNTNTGYYSQTKLRLSTTSGTISEVEIHPINCHIPYDFVHNNSVGYNSLNYDYALLYVSEDLHSYGKFDCGFYLDGIECLKNDNDSIDVSLLGFVKESHINGSSSAEIKVGRSDGQLYDYETFRQTLELEHYGNLSGGAYYTNTTYGNQVYQTVFGIHNGSANKYELVLARGCRFSPALLYFLLHNPYLTTDPS